MSLVTPLCPIAFPLATYFQWSVHSAGVVVGMMPPRPCRDHARVDIGGECHSVDLLRLECLQGPS